MEKRGLKCAAKIQPIIFRSSLVKQMPESAKHEDRIGFLPFSAKTRGKNTSASKKKPKNNGLFGIGAKKM